MVLVLCGMTIPFGAQAASPDAGTILRDIEDKPTLPARERDGTIETLPRETTPEIKGPRVLVKGFQIKGATLFTEETLQGVLTEYINKELTFAQLLKAAEKITSYYAAQGYVTRAYLPPQELVDGIIKIILIEGRLEDVVPDKDSESRLDFNRAKQYIIAAQDINKPLRLDRIERGMLLLNDLPGITAASNLRAGTKEGMAEQIVKLSDTPFITGSLDIDNTGSRAAGEYRTNVNLNLNNPGGIGDRLSVRVLGGFGDNISHRLSYGKVSYSLPLGYSGLRFGGSVAAMDYDLGANLQDSEAKGKSAVYSLFGAYPLIRQRQHNLHLSLSYDHKRLDNEFLGATVSDKEINAVTLSLNGDRLDNFMGRGLTSIAISLTMGKLDLGRWQADLDQDNTSARTHGDYTVARFSLLRLQRLADKTSLRLKVTHSQAFDNLDSSEDFSLGGASGVRAYPANEATGDQGTLAAIELNQRLTDRLNLFAFYDYGRIKINHQQWTTTTTPNSYSLEGVGAGISYIKPGSFMIKLTAADRLGSNPVTDTDGHDADGTKRTPRIWLEMSKSF